MRIVPITLPRFADARGRLDVLDCDRELRFIPATAQLAAANSAALSSSYPLASTCCVVALSGRLEIERDGISIVDIEAPSHAVCLEDVPRASLRHLSSRAASLILSPVDCVSEAAAPARANAFRTAPLAQSTGSVRVMTLRTMTEDMPFRISRAYYIHDVPQGRARAGHAHRKLQQVLISATGSMDVIVDDGSNSRIERLEENGSGLYLGGLVWREITNFSPGAVCLALASEPYSPADYIHDYSEFRNACETRKAR